MPVAGRRAESARRLTQRSGSIDSIAGGANVTVNGQGAAGVAPEGVPQVLSEIVAPTAGQVLTLAPDASVSRIFKAMLDDFRSTYVLQYVPQGVDSRGWHDVDVNVRKHGKFDIRARKGYRGRDTIPREEKP